MKRVILVVCKGHVVNVRKFETITEAYRCYLKEFSTFGEWADYLRYEHKMLNRVHDEEIMEYIFENVFGKNVQLVLDNGQ